MSVIIGIINAAECIENIHSDYAGLKKSRDPVHWEKNTVLVEGHSFLFG